jgi:hypothetical protein
MRNNSIVVLSLDAAPRLSFPVEGIPCMVIEDGCDSVSIFVPAKCADRVARAVAAFQRAMQGGIENEQRL